MPGLSWSVLVPGLHSGCDVLRIPGTAPAIAWTIRAFDLTPADQSAIRRGWGTTKAITGGVVVDASTGGYLVSNPKALVTAYIVPAVATALSKGRREYKRLANGGPTNGEEAP